MENKKLKVNVNLETGNYIFYYDEEEADVMSMIDENRSMTQVMKSAYEELREEYGFSEDMISRVDPILYMKLGEYDEINGTGFMTKYLNIIAKELSKKEGESSQDYEARALNARKQAFEDAGIELSYIMVTPKEMPDMPLGEKIKLISMARKQKANGARVSSGYEPLESEEVVNMPKVEENKVKAKEMVAEESDETAEPKAYDTSKMKVPSFLKRLMKPLMLNLEDDNIDEEQVIATENEPLVDEVVVTEGIDVEDKKIDLDVSVDEEDKKVESVAVHEPKVEPKVEPVVVPEPKVEPKVESAVEHDKPKIEPVVIVNPVDTPKIDKDDKKTTVQNPVIPKPKKEVSRRKRIQASKNAMRESKKMKNVYKQKISQSTKPTTIKTQPQKTKAQKTAEYKAKHMAPKTQKKELEYIPIVDGKMVGVDENRKSAIVKTFVVPSLAKEDIGLESVVAHDDTKQEKIVHRYTRKLKSKADSIRNKVTVSKDRFKKLAIGAAAVVGAVAVVGFASILPKIGITSQEVELGGDYSSGITIQAYDGVEQIASGELEEKAAMPQEVTLMTNEATLETTYLRDSSNVGSDTLQAEETSTVRENQALSESEEKEVEIIEEEAEVKEDTVNDSITYMENVKVGTTMTIDSGRYFETPEGTGDYGYFENHAGETKIISQIGIAADKYVSITTDDFNLLELKEMYPDGKFSYHIVDNEGHILGWLTSESFEEKLKEQDDNEKDDKEKDEEQVKEQKSQKQVDDDEMDR